MSLNLRLRTGQFRSQAITAQVIQSIKLLQFNREELQAFINEQVEKNPLIDISGLGDGESKSDPADPNSRPDQNWRSPDREELTLVEAAPRVRSAGNTNLRPAERELQGMPRRSHGRFAEYDSAGGHNSLESFVAINDTLRDHLRSQLGMAIRDPIDRMIAAEIIESLDDDGYLRRDINLIAEALNASEARIEGVLGAIQKMDPAGVAARSLAECLKLQLEDKSCLTPAMDTLLGNLPQLANYEYQHLAAVCGVEVDDILAMAREIRELDPRPGCKFDRGPTMPAFPDVRVEMRDDGTLVTELDTRFLPRVLVNRQYYSEVKANCRGADDIRFVTDCIKSANWLVKNLDRRAHTILKVATEIVARQRDFLVHGVEHLKPLSLKDVADAVGIHQSTVCRAISDKYIMTNRGQYELKFFFANSIAGIDGGENLSSDTVRHKIRQMIAGETAGSILSDDAIVKELRSEGVDIARRTVAKYRENMYIPSSLQRRRQKRAETPADGPLSKKMIRDAASTQMTASGPAFAMQR